MYISNNTDKKIYWRTFNNTETVYGAGLGDGILEPNEYTSWWSGSRTDKVQLEVKKEGLLGEFIQKASTSDLYGMEDEVTIDSDGVKKISYEVTQ